jgi:serine/threonine protein kinase
MSLRHPNIVKTFECGITTDDEEFLVMEFVDGVSLSYLVESQNTQMKKNCLWYCIQLGEALDAVHRAGYIHRDLCPRNVIVSNEYVVKLIDFGLVVPNTDPYKKPGNRTGTANYMAPELIKRQATDERIDIFSYAVTCFEMFTKQLPWDSGDTLESVLQHINSPPRDIKKFAPKLDDQVCQAIMKGLERDPRDRWQTVREMILELRAAAERLRAIPSE